MKVIRRLNIEELKTILRDAFECDEGCGELRFNISEQRGPHDEATGDWQLTSVDLETEEER